MEDLKQRHRNLTPRQLSILEFLNDFIKARGYPPSLREICGRFNIKGPKNAMKHLAALQKKGFIKREPRASRALNIVGRAGHAQTMPILGRVTAGSPNLAIEDKFGSVSLDGRFFKCADAFMLKVEGDSMIDAGIGHGDLVIVRPQNHALDKDIVVAMIDGEATVKRFIKKKDAIVLKPENPELKPISIPDGSDFSVIGKVMFVIKDVDGK